MMRGCQCGGVCGDCQGGLSGWLGALAPADAVAQAIGSDSHVNTSSRAAILASANAEQMLDASGQPAYIPGSADCAAVSSPGSNNLNLVQAGTGLALTGLQIGLTTAGVVTGAALAPFTAGISTIIGLFTMLSAHHAAAVKKEQSVLCSAVPAANNYLQIIDQAVHGGLASPQDGIAALDSLYSDFQSNVSSIRNDCNAACVMGMELAAIVAVKKAEYQDLLSGAQQTVIASRPNSTAPSGSAAPASSYASFYSSGSPAGSTPAVAAASSSSDWLPIAAIAIGAIFLLRGI